jgi:hypothetical protein
MTTTNTPTARSVSAMIRRTIGAGNASCSTRTTGAVLVVVTGNADRTQDRELLARAIAAAAIREGWDASRTGAVLTITAPEPVEVDGPSDEDECGQCGSPRSSARHTPLGHTFVEEPVIVRAGQAAPLAQHDAPRQDAPAEVTPERVADAILDRRPILDLYGRPAELTREQAETVDAGVTLATKRLAARYGVTPAEVIRLGRDVVEETSAPVEPGPEVDDPREQPEPVEWSEVAGAGA